MSWTSEEWQARAVELCRVNDANGFDRPTWDNLCSKAMLVVTELGEARNAVVCAEGSLLEELADTAIRLVHVLESVWPGSWALRSRADRAALFQPVEVSLWQPLVWLCDAVECWREEKRVDTRICLEYALAAVVGYGVALQQYAPGALYAAIDAKIAKNAARGRLHGKARSA